MKPGIYLEEALKAGMKPICIWSFNHKKHITKEQLAAHDYLFTHERVPPQYDLFIFNKSCETSIDLHGHLDYMIAALLSILFCVFIKGARNQ